MSNMRAWVYKCVFGAMFVFACALAPSRADAAILYLTPSSGTYTVGSTFDVSLLLNTEGETINTIAANINFPADRLQLVSPSTGNSIISLWITPPSADNIKGKVVLQGGLPGGVSFNNGLVITLTFRVKSVGPAQVSFASGSEVLLHNGRGTNSLRETTNAYFNLVLPPPAGPLVTSETHPNQAQWYANTTAWLKWRTDAPVDGYSYILSSDPIEEPDSVVDGTKTSITYSYLSDGPHYFHIKAIHNGSWGGTTHFAVKVDSSPPAEFPVEILPFSRTSQTQPIIRFSTTDALAGLDHYEIKIIALSGDVATKTEQPLFIETNSPYVPPNLPLGTYDVIVRAYDTALNYRESTKHLAIVSPAMQFVGPEGIVVGQTALPWTWAIILLILLFIIVYVIRHWVRRAHYDVAQERDKKRLPDHVAEQLAELQKFRAKYGHLVLLLVLVSLLCSHVSYARAQSTEVELPPPLVTAVSRAITNNEIFYIGGTSAIPLSTVVVYLQNRSSGQTISAQTQVDSHGEWFYRHSQFISSGDYVLWAQSLVGEQLIPSSGQIAMSVRTTALQIGSLRLSFDGLYMTLLAIAFLAIALLLVDIIRHRIKGKKHHSALMREIREAEESVRRGFALIRRDIAAELALVHKHKQSRELTDEEKVREKQLLEDLTHIEHRVGKEIWDLEQLEFRGP